jgi:Ser/Thr protein kinase RdoA (MazF antagonist)
VASQLTTVAGYEDAAPLAAEVAASLRDALTAGAAVDEGRLRSAGLEVLDGGRNNRVFRWDAGGCGSGPVCVKVYKVDDRRRLDREWSALTALAAEEVEGVPRPMWRLSDADLPIMAMSLVAA